MENEIKKFWDDYINWEIVNENLSKYPNLNEIFSLELLQRYKDKKPFYIHPLTLWLNDQGPNTKPATARLETLIARLKNCEGWKQKEDLFAQYQDTNKFWDTLSELEIACALQNLGFTIKLLEKGNMPDIEAKIGDDVVYIEVYNFKKFFYRIFQLELIIERINATNELLEKYETKIEVERNVGITSNISEKKVEEIVKTVIEFLKQEDEATYVLDEYPYIIYRDDGNLQIVLASQNTANYNPEKSLSHVRYEGYLDQMFKEITTNKGNFKQLDNASGVKIGAINVLFNSDFQIALSGWDKVTNIVLPGVTDCLVLYANSIDEKFNFGKTRYSKFRDNDVERKIRNLLPLPVERKN